MSSNDRKAEPPRWHNVLGPTRTVLVLFWFKWICTVVGWVTLLGAFFVWFTFESTRGRYISYDQTPAERWGIEGALTNPTETAILVFVCGIGLLVGSALLGGLRDRVRSHYVD